MNPNESAKHYEFIVRKMEAVLAEQKAKMGLEPHDERRLAENRENMRFQGEMSIIRLGIAQATRNHFFAAHGLLKADERGPEMTYMKFLGDLQWTAHNNRSENREFYAGHTAIVARWIAEVEAIRALRAA